MCHGVLSLQLPIYVFASISANSGDLILALGENISEHLRHTGSLSDAGPDTEKKVEYIYVAPKLMLWL